MEAKLMVDAAYQRTLDLLMGKKEELIKVAELLMEKETITHDDVVDMIGARPFAADAEYQKYISERSATKLREEKTARAKEEAAEEEKKEEDDSSGGIPPLGLV